MDAGRRCRGNRLQGQQPGYTERGTSPSCFRLDIDQSGVRGTSCLGIIVQSEAVSVLTGLEDVRMCVCTGGIGRDC